jgi:predicted nucleic acid-binding protein
VLSSITVMELEHGLHLARTAKQASKRRAYLDTVYAAVPVEPLTREMAQLAAKIDADARRLGAALHFGYAVGTRNLPHFQMVPNLPDTHLSVPPSLLRA